MTAAATTRLEQQAWAALYQEAQDLATHLAAAGRLPVADEDEAGDLASRVAERLRGKVLPPNPVARKTYLVRALRNEAASKSNRKAKRDASLEEHERAKPRQRAADVFDPMAWQGALRDAHDDKALAMVLLAEGSESSALRQRALARGRGVVLPKAQALLAASEDHLSALEALTSWLCTGPAGKVALAGQELIDATDLRASEILARAGVDWSLRQPGVRQILDAHQREVVELVHDFGRLSEKLAGMVAVQGSPEVATLAGLTAAFLRNGGRAAVLKASATLLPRAKARSKAELLGHLVYGIAPKRDLGASGRFTDTHWAALGWLAGYRPDVAEPAKPGDVIGRIRRDVALVRARRRGQEI